MKTLAIFILAAASFPGFSEGGEKASAHTAAITWEELNKAGFKSKALTKLKEEEQAAFNKVYSPDKEMLDRVVLGLINKAPLSECIAGEAPSVKEALEKFPGHYPMRGRMQKISGSFEWKDKTLFFRSKTQLYQVDEYHILYQLEKKGLERNSEPVRAIIDAVWMVNPLNGLRIIYMQHVKLEPPETGTPRS